MVTDRDTGRSRGFAFSGDAEMLETKARREFESERPLFVVEEVAIRRLAQGGLGFVERDAQALAVLFDGGF